MSGGIYRSEILNYYKITIPNEIAWNVLNGYLKKLKKKKLNILFKKKKKKKLLLILFFLRNWINLRSSFRH